MNKVNLLEQLEQKIQSLYHQFSLQKDQKIYAKFDRTLFSESFETFDFYMDEIELTLFHLKGLSDDEYQQCQFYCQKLLAQCSALNDAISHKNSASGYTSLPKSGKKILSRREKSKEKINQLPPRDRLTKYYEALNILNLKIEQQKSLQSQAEGLQEKALYDEKIKATEQRRANCLDAIEVLEEYLAFESNRSEQK